MTRAARSLVVLTAAGLLAACTSDGQLGENGLVRFSQVVHFADTDDFTAPLAMNRTLLVALQSPHDNSIGDEETLADLRIEVRWEDGGKLDRAWPLGFGQHAINIDEEGEFRIVALRDDTPIDSVRLSVVEQARIRFSQRYVVTTYGPDNKCVEVKSHDSGLENFVLRPNQALTVYVVSEDDQGRALLGLLPLSAIVPSGMFVDSQLVGHGAMANALTLAPGSAELGSEMSIRVRDEETRQELTLNLKTDPTDAVLDCEQSGN